jgi:hypothetical protein
LSFRILGAQYLVLSATPESGKDTMLDNKVIFMNNLHNRLYIPRIPLTSTPLGMTNYKEYLFQLEFCLLIIKPVRFQKEPRSQKRYFVSELSDLHKNSKTPKCFPRNRKIYFTFLMSINILPHKHYSTISKRWIS